MTGDTNNDWKKTLYDCKIQGYPLREYLDRLYMYENTLEDDWTKEDFENFIKAYSIVLTQIDRVQYELKQFEKMREQFEEVFKTKYR